MATLGFGAGCGAGSSFTACRHSFQTHPPSGGSGGAGGAGKPAGGKLAKDIAKDEVERLRTAGGGAGEITRDVDTKPRGVRPPTARTPQEMRDAWANRKGS